ncbi:MAG: LicD family protein [Nocardioides sp.]|nr:LicD family protein [Nocardioides sp.]
MRFDQDLVDDYLEATHAVGEHLLDVFARVCHELDIPFFVTSGTLLGAVRSGSWIPWDDDVDVIMFRDDYARLQHVIGDHLPDGVAFSSPETRDDHITVIPRLVHLDSHRVHVGRRRSRAPLETLHIPMDIFILDRAPRTRWVRRAWSGVARGLDKAASARYTLARDVVAEPTIGVPRKAAELLGVALSRVLSRRGWHAVRTAWVTLPARLGSRGAFVATNYSTVRGRKMTFEEEWYLPAGTIEFSGRTYPAPGDTDAVLTELYGPSYLEPPAESDRQPDHIRGGLQVSLDGRSWTIAPETTEATEPESVPVEAAPEEPEDHLRGSSFRRQVMWSLVARATAAVLQILVLVLLARSLPPYLFAFVIAVNVVLQVAVAVNGFGLLRQIEYRRSRDPDDPSLPSLFMARLAFSWASAVLWVVTCLVLYAISGHVYFFALIPAALWLLVEQTTQVWNGISVVDGNSRNLLVSYASRRLPVVLTLAAAMALDLTWGKTIMAWTMGLAAGSVLSYAVGLRGQEPWARVWWPRRSGITEPIPFELGYWWGLVGLQLRDLDVAAVGAVNADVAGLYAFPARLVSPMNLVTVAASSNAFPRVARHGITRAQLRRGTLFGLMPVTLVAVVTASLASYLPDVIGDDYAGSVDVLRVTCFTAVVSGAASLLGMLVQALSNQDAKVMGFLSLGFAVAQVGAAAVAAHYGGAVVIALAVAGVNAVMALTVWTYANRRVAAL